MFFKKKKEELSDQLAVFQERKAPRWGAPQVTLSAGISIEGFDGEGLVGNVSVSGCSIQSVTYVNIAPNKVYHVRITPGSDDMMDPFDLKLKLSWAKSSETLFQAGFSLENDGPQLKRFVEMLRARGVPPDYGRTTTGSNKP